MKKVRSNILKLLPLRQYDRTNECYICEDGTVLDIVGIRCKDLETQSNEAVSYTHLTLPTNSRV